MQAATNRVDGTAYADDLLRLKHCPICGYDLTGLPRRHRCPECGFEYDECMFVLDLYAAPSRRPGRLEWLVRTALMASVFPLLAFVLLLKTPGVLRGGGWLGLASIILVSVAGVVAIRWRSYRSEHSERRRVFFAADGYRWTRRASGPCDSLDTVEALMKLEDGQSQLTPPALRGKSFQEIERDHILRTLAAVAVPLRVRPDDVWGGVLVPWSEFREVRVRREAGDWHKLSLVRAATHRLEITLDWLECTAAEAEALRAEIGRRILASR